MDCEAEIEVGTFIYYVGTYVVNLLLPLSFSCPPQ